MTATEGHCEHGARVRVTDRRNPSEAKINVFTCASPCCMHEAFHIVHDKTGTEHPLIIPLPPV